MKRLTLKQIVALALLAVLLVFPVIAFAQESTPETPAGEGTTTETETSAEGEEAAAEGEEVAEEEASISPLAPLGINQGFLIAQIINFLVIFGLLSFLMWGPLTRMLDNRSATIAKGLEDAAAAANARRNAESDAEKILAQARAEAAKLVEEARGRGEEVGKAVEAEAQTTAEKIRQDARISAEADRNTELAGLRGQVTAISMAVAQRLIGANLDENRQKAMIDEFFTKVPESARSLSGEVTVVSAMPLGDSEKSKISSQIGASDITYTVDPSILGGLLIRAGDRVIDGSVRSGLNDMQSRLN